MRINPAIANEMYLNYESESNSSTDSTSSSSSSTATSILPKGTYSNLAAAKYIKDNDKDNDGKLSSDEVSISAAAFAALDKNSDGYVSLSEMKTALSGDDNAIFAYYKNGGASSGQKDVTTSLLNGTSSTSSNAAVNTYVKMAAKAYISANDTNGDGKLSASEVSLTSNAFVKMDTNSNGSLSLSELENALSGQGESIYKYYKNGGTQKLSTLTTNLLATI
ncbi:MAG: hypothetical protein P4L39_02820 [Humidesulfovibrio sp.]|nr:hypothetical protein [Humidesulfovibrio sp.]